jgi:hypothetical protein
LATVAKSRWQRAGIIAGCVLVAWIVVLVILGVAFGGSRAERIAERIGESLQAQATIADHDLALVRGRFAIDHLRVLRDDVVGKLALDVGKIRCELGPLGVALIDSSCRELAISNIRLSLSTFALLKLRKPKRPPIRAGAIVIDDAELVFSPSAVVASLGKMRLVIEHAEAGPTTLKTPLSWIFQMHVLEATLDLPIGTIKLRYANGMMTAAGSIFGATPVTVPFPLPPVDPADEPQQEIERLVKLGRELAERLVAQKTRDWLRDKLPGR